MEYGNENNIRELLERYFAGETSLDQERALGNYFATEDVPDDLRYARAIFAHHRATAATTTDIVVRRPRRNMVRRVALSLSSVAAAAVIGMGVWLTVRHERQTIYCYVNGIAVNNVEDARMMTREALDKVDDSLNRVNSSMNTVSNANSSVEKLEKAISMITIK